MTELMWDGKYKDGKKVGPVRIALPFQTVETVNETAQQRQLTLDMLFAGRETEWRNRLVWGDKKYVLPSLLPEFGSVLEARKCVLNLIPCDNDFEYEFAKFLECAKDVIAFSKLPQQFGFSIEYTDNNANLRYYYPDFVVKTELGEMWLVETKGQGSLEVAFKDRAARMWCENATKLTGEQWRYVKVPQKEYGKLQPVEFYDLLTFVG
jgi:type III restriction enzyme